MRCAWNLEERKMKYATIKKKKKFAQKADGQTQQREEGAYQNGLVLHIA